jgi:iron complex outermembrane receptor protein
MRHHFLGGVSVVAVTISLCASQAYAAAAAAPAADVTTNVEELIVTAEKRAERLQDVPVAITAFSAEQRSLIGIESIQDLTNFTPGLHYNSIANRPYLRGVGRNTDNLAVASAVAIYYNGVYDGANATTILQHSDLFIDTIEVDRGPQNTLHGANADGGTINYLSKRPTKELYAEARAGVGNYDKYFVEGVVSGPIMENLRFRLGANYTDEGGGFFHNLALDQRVGGTGPQGNSGRTQYLEGQLEGNWDKVDGWFMASSGTYWTNYHTVATRGAYPTNFTLNGAFSPSSFYGLCGLAGVPAANPGCSTGPAVVSVTPAGSVTAANFPGNNPSTADPRQFVESAPSTNKQRADLSLATNWTWHAPGVDVTYLGGWQKFYYDLDFTAALDAGLKTFSLAGAAPASAGFCALNAPIQGLSAAGCTAPLAINPSPNWTHFVEDDTFYSHELNLTSTGAGPFQWIAGGYYYHEKYDQPVWAGVMPNQTQLAHPFAIGGNGLLVATPANPANAISTSDTKLTYTTWALFGQASYKFSDAWKFTGGLRYTEDKKEGRQFWRFEEFDITNLGGPLNFTSTGFGANTPALDFTSIAVGANATTAYKGAGLATLNPATGNYERALSDTWDAVTGDADIDWTPDHDTLVYAKYSRGYKAGGFSTFTIAANPETQKETVDAYELGLKKTIASRLQVNAAAFFYDYQNDQIPLAVQNAQGLIATQLFNLKSVHVYGIEIEGVWRPIDPLNITFQYSHLSAEVNDAGACIEDTVDPLALAPGANTSGCTQTSATAKVQNLKGEQLPEAPPNKLSLNGLYTWDFAPGKLTLSGTFTWKDETYGSLFNRPYALAPSYSQVDFRLTWKDAKDRYSVIAFVNNIFDATGYDNATGNLVLSPALSPPAGYVTINQSLIAPRVYGLQLQYRFH